MIKIIILLVFSLVNIEVLIAQQNVVINESLASSVPSRGVGATSDSLALSRDLIEVVKDQLRKDSLLTNDIDTALTALIADGAINTIYKVKFDRLATAHNNNYCMTLIFLVSIGAIVFILYWYKRREVSNIALSNMFLSRYAKIQNSEGVYYVKIFLTNLKTNKICILEDGDYKELDGGISSVLESIHPLDRNIYMNQRREFIKGRVSTLMIYVRMFQESSNNYHLKSIVFNRLERDLFGKVLQFHAIVQNETLQNAREQKKLRDLHDLNLAVQSARLIRWDLDLSTSINKFVNIDDGEYIHTNSQLFKLIPQCDYRQLRSLFSHLKRNKKVDSFTVNIDIFGDGTYKAYEVMATLVCNEDGSPSHIYGILKDVSKLLRYQNMLSREVYINKAIRDSVNAALTFYDSTGLCKDVNSKVQEYFGYAKEMYIDKINLFEFKHTSSETKTSLKSGKSVSYTASYGDVIRIVDKDIVVPSEKIDEMFSVDCSPVFGHDKELIGYISIIIDITEITRSRKNIEELNRKVSLALDAGDLLVWTYDFNEDAYTLIGALQSSYLPKTMDESLMHISPETRGAVINAYDAIKTRKSQKETYLASYMVDGKSYVYRTTIAARESEGGVLQIVGVSKNISEEVSIKSDLTAANIMLDSKNNELNFNNQLLQELIEHMPGCLFIKDIDEDYKYYIANSCFCDNVLNKSKEVVIGSTDFDLLPKELAELFREGDLSSVINNKPFEIDETIVVNGCKTMWKTVKTPVTLANGKKMLICLAMDITEIYAQKNKAQQSDALKSQFLANVSHELRTPLNAIVGFSNLLVDTDDYETKKDFNEIITTNSDLLLNLINDILDLSKIESGVVSVEKDFFNVNDLLDDSHLSFSMRMKPGVTIKCTKLDQDWSVKSDSKRFKQILNNFLSNAMKYTPSGEIIFGCESERDGIRLFVKDTGIGISEENQTKVFNRFEKLDSFAQGTGLGLSICKALVDLMAGEIGFESELSKGSHFWIWIPCEKKVKQLLY